MKMQRILAFAAVMALSFAAQAHDCSGGAAGGMDATGNQCSDEATYSPASLSTMPAASPVAQRTTRHDGSSVATIKPVATNAANAPHVKTASQHAPKKYSHRVTKKHPSTTG
jgi:hypothetical protein